MTTHRKKASRNTCNLSFCNHNRFGYSSLSGGNQYGQENGYEYPR